MNHQEGASPIRSGTGSATSQPATSSRLRPRRSASAPAARLVNALAAPKATTKARIAEVERRPKSCLPTSGSTLRSRPTIAADERVQADEQAELASVRAQPQPDRVGHAIASTLPDAVGGDDPLLPVGAGGHVREQRVGERVRVGELEHRVVRALEADRGERVAREAAAADRAAVVARVEHDVVGQLEQPAETLVQEPRLPAQRRRRRAGRGGRRHRSGASRR